MANLTGLIVSKQTGSLFPPLFSAPYTVPRIYGQSSNVAAIFAKGSNRPLLYSFDVVSGIGYPFKRMNCAVCGTAAATLYKAGDQTATFAAGGTSNWQPCWFGNQIACALTSGFGPPSGLMFLYQDGDPFGTGKVSSPTPIAYVPSPGGASGISGSNSWTIVYQNQNGWDFGQLVYVNGTPRIQGWGPSGLNTSLQIQPINQIGGGGPINALSIGYFQGVGNVILTFDAISGPQLYLLFYDNTFQFVSSYIVQLDNAQYQTYLGQGLSNFTQAFKCQVCAGGFLITIGNVSPSNTYGGVARNYAQFFLAANGLTWAPVVPFGTDNISNTIVNSSQYPNYSTVDFHLDPEGIYWASYVNGSNPLNIYNSFGQAFSLPITPPWQNINLPSFNLSCYTPCDIVSPVIPKP